MVEYALGAGLVVATAVAVSPQLAASITTVFGDVIAALQAAGGGAGGTASPVV
jgi:hypothetical protein